jgi:hypothetical protein
MRLCGSQRRRGLCKKRKIKTDEMRISIHGRRTRLSPHKVIEPTLDEYETAVNRTPGLRMQY